MPNRDHTGPEAQGPMTGRQLGDCREKEDNRELAARPRLGLQRGFGRGRSARGGGRRLHRNRFLNE